MPAAISDLKVQMVDTKWGDQFFELKYWSNFFRSEQVPHLCDLKLHMKIGELKSHERFKSFKVAFRNANFKNLWRFFLSSNENEVLRQLVKNPTFNPQRMSVYGAAEKGWVDPECNQKILETWAPGTVNINEKLEFLKISSCWKDPEAIALVFKNPANITSLELWSSMGRRDLCILRDIGWPLTSLTLSINNNISVKELFGVLKEDKCSETLATICIIADWKGR